jgi:hypothetical protein
MPYGWQPASTQKKKDTQVKRRVFSLLLNIRDTLDYLVVKEKTSFFAEVRQVFTSV